MPTIPKERMEALVRERILSDYPEEAVARLRLPDWPRITKLVDRLLERNRGSELVNPRLPATCPIVQSHGDIEVLPEDLEGTGLSWRLLPSLVTAGYITEYTAARTVISPHPVKEAKHGKRAK